MSGQYLKMYESLIGPYPWRAFALVENFWETGYGLPSFPLLGADSPHQASVKVRPVLELHRRLEGAEREDVHHHDSISQMKASHAASWAAAR